MGFTGREEYLELLSRDLTDAAVSGRGRFVLMRGRRRVGKSRLVEEFLKREQPPSVFFSASRQRPDRELELFADALGRSGLPAASVVQDGDLGSWDAALSLVAATTREPTVVVVDEFPFLLEGDPSIEGTFQKIWDREFQSKPVLLILIGSDLAVMDAVREYGRPLFGRPTRVMTVKPFSPAEIAGMIGLDASEALDAYLVLGGSPLIAQSRLKRHDFWSFLRDSLTDPTSPLIVDGERSLAAEFPAEVQARQVLNAIGSGERTFTAIGSRSGAGQSSLQRALDLLVEEKRVVARSSPFPLGKSKERRYVVADPYLRFWLRFIGPHMDELERGRADLVLERIRAAWPTYRGKAVEPIVREAIELLLPDLGFSPTSEVGTFWTRRNDVEIDVVVGEPKREDAVAVGSIKWRDVKPFDVRDRDELVQAISKIPSSATHPKLVGVSRSGFSTTDLDIQLSPDDLLDAWRNRGSRS